MSGIAVTKLDNGIRVVTDHMPTVESVSIGVWVRAGARYETQEANGFLKRLSYIQKFSLLIARHESST